MNKLINGNLIKDLKFVVLNEGKVDLKRPVTTMGLHRMGLELSGVYNSTHSEKQIIGWGTKESKWLQSLGKAEACKAIKRVLTPTSPLIVLSQGVSEEVTKWIVEESNLLSIPVAKLNYHLSYAFSAINWYSAKHLAPSVDVHGSLVVVYGVGVLIIGPSGIGKSESVLELIQDGQLFISDDTAQITQIGDEFIARAAKITAGYLEARGIGLIDVQHMYGAQTVKNETPLRLVIELVPGKQMNELDRLGNMNLTYKVLDGEIPKIQIPVEHGRNVAALIKAATSAFISKKEGMDALAVISERIRNNGGEDDL